MRFNDIWAFLHDERQHWYYRADMDHGQAYLFDTLGEPHGACAVPGEVQAEALYLLLQQQQAQLAAGERPTPAPGDKPAAPADTPAPLRAAIDVMWRAAKKVPGSADDESASSWRVEASGAMDRVIRKSLEMRVVALLLPDFWPFNRA